MSNAKDGRILSKDEWKSMFTILPENINMEFEPFCAGCDNGVIDITANEDTGSIKVTCSHIKGCKWAYEKGKSEAEKDKEAVSWMDT